MLKITILALHLSAGGTEKSVATISNMLAKRCEIEIISNYKLEETPAFEIDDRVKIRYLMPNLKPNAKEFKMAVKSFKIGTALKEGIKALRILYLRKALMKKEIKKLDSFSKQTEFMVDMGIISLLKLQMNIMIMVRKAIFEKT